MPRSRSADERVRYGRLVHAFIRAGWNPPVPNDRVTERLIDAIAGAQPQATLDLSQREAQVLELLADGLTRAQIATRIGVSEEMVKDYTARVRRKLGARNGSHAVALAFRRGMLA